MAGIVFNNVCKVYDKDVEAVKNFTLEVEDREFLILVGPSGCGKSTLLRMLAGLEDITSGEILIDGEVINEVHPKDRNIAMVFQDYALYPNMTVFDNMAFSLKLKKENKKVIKEKVENAAKILKIEELLERLPKALSGGQRQRVALGRAIVRDPKVFLLDEPLSNLDAKLRTETRAEIIKLHEKINGTFVYVTHDQTEAMTMASKIVVMNKGTIQQIDTPLNLYNKPTNLFVASFIGSPNINILEGKAVKKGNKTEIIYNDYKLAEFKNLSSDEEDIYIAIRPEDIIYDNESDFRAKISFIEEMGSRSYVFLNNGINDFIMEANKSVVFERDKDVGMYLKPEKLHIFSKSTEERLNF